MKEERIKELEDMMYMINNYEILGTSNDIYWTSDGFIRYYKKYKIFLRRTEYSKVIKIRYTTDGYKITKTTDYDYTKLLANVIDYFAIFTIKNAIVVELMELGAEKVF